jgi:competence protein ComEC
MERQGYSGRVTISERRMVTWRQNHRENLHHLAVAKLQSLLPRSNGSDVAISLALGAKRTNSRDVKRSYSLSGVSHLLAVSGLHVGIVAMLLSLLLLPLSLVWRGNSIRAWIIVALIWLYVALCGYPTSAIRAAIMFSTLQLSHLTRNRYSQENSLFTAAFIMLAIKPTILFELSFNLSFIAVIAIIFVSKPINSAIYCKNSLLREAINGVVVSVASVIATAPLISNTFGIISTLSIFLTPVALIFAQIIIISSMLALVMPHSIAQTLFRAAEWCADIQNSFIERAVEMGIGYTELRIEDSTTAIIYATMALLLIISFGFRAKKE